MRDHNFPTRQPTVLDSHCNIAPRLWGAAAGVGVAVLQYSGLPRVRERKGWQVCLHTMLGALCTHSYGSSHRASCFESRHHMPHTSSKDALCVVAAEAAACMQGWGLGSVGGACG